MPKVITAHQRRLGVIKQRAQMFDYLAEVGTQEGMSRLPNEHELAQARRNLAAAGAMWVFRHRGLSRSNW